MAIRRLLLVQQNHEMQGAEIVDTSAACGYMRRMIPQSTASDSVASAAAPLLPILIAPHKMLRSKARRLVVSDALVVRELVPRMFAAMYDAPGIGLAAPQVGTNLRLVVIDLAPDDKRAPLVLINPEIVQASQELATREEGCLSLPKHYADVTRPARVRVRYEDMASIRREIDADGLLSACIQHEIDHLDGILFVDYLSALKRNIIMRKLAKEQRQKSDEKPSSRAAL